MLRACLLSVTVAASSLGLAAQQDEATWWAYRPLQRPDVPSVQSPDRVRSPIDAFVLAGLEARGLQPAAEADRHTLLRRVTYDLTGLPPTQQEIDAFVNDDAPGAYERVVDRLLASPQHGVKWAQHWLDLVRYAETDGYERDHEKPFVWRYRDWVVDALNADMPYGEFVTKQLCGDELPDATLADHIATGYFRLGIWDDEPTDKLQHRYDDLDGIADTTARAMLGVSMGCARCHDHKKDPLPQREYHGFLGYFENIAPYDRAARSLPVDGARAVFDAAMSTYERDSRRWREELLGLIHAGARSARAAPDGRQNARIAAFGGDEAAATQLLDGVGAHHGRVVGQVVQIDGVHGKALRFDGDDHAVLPRFVDGSFSVAFFVRSSEPGGGDTGEKRWFLGTGLVDGETPGVVDDWGIAWLGDGVVAAGTGRPDTFVSSAPGLADGAWHHVAFTRDAPRGRIALYVDGRLVDSANGSRRPLTSPADIYVGRSRPGGRGFRGDLDQLEFYDGALRAAEVAALALTGSTDGAPCIDGTDALVRFQALREPRLATQPVLAVFESGRDAPAPRVRIRGNANVEGDVVELGVPSMLGDLPVPAPRPVGDSSGRRSALAKWIVDPDNRATWRVVANRLWQHHFGRGLVRTSNDFGRLGDRPTHPALLDWLACELLARGQSLKAMHRLIVTSSTYRRSSRADERALAQDPLNDSFWRFDRRRLTAEEVRDSILSVNGARNDALGGPSVFPPMPKAVLATASRPDTAWGRSSPADAARRSLFVHVKRSLPEPLLASFDRADTDSSCPVRFATVQPTQALTMVNGDFAQRQAQRFADLLAQRAQGLEAQLRLGLERVSQRPARDDDLQRLLTLAGDLQRDHGRSEGEALQRCCLVLLNCNEFLFLD